MIVWDVAEGSIRQVAVGHIRGMVDGLDVAPDGRTAYTGGGDRRTFAWDLEGDRGLVRQFAADRAFVPDDGDELPRGLALRPDGRTLAVGHSDGMVDLVDARTLRRRRSFRAMGGFVSALAFSRDGRLLAVAGQHGRLTLWDPRTLRAVGKLGAAQPAKRSPSRLTAPSWPPPKSAPTRGRTTRAAGSASGISAAVPPPDSTCRLPQRPCSPSVPTAGGLRWPPGGRSTEVRDVDAAGDSSPGCAAPQDHRAVAFSPDGRLIVTGDYDGTAQLWSTENWKPIGRPLTGHDGLRLLWLGFTRDSTTIAKAGQDGTIELMDVARPAGSDRVERPARQLPRAALEPDGQTTFAVSDQRAALRWNLSPDAWKRHACRIAGRELTPLEWADALPGEPYREICRAR